MKLMTDVVAASRMPVDATAFFVFVVALGSIAI